MNKQCMEETLAQQRGMVKYIDTIKLKMEELGDSRKGVVDLRYSAGEWAVMVSMGNIMVCVPGSISKNPIESLGKALELWRNRSPEHPFI